MRDAPCWSPATCWPRPPRPSTTWWSSTTAGCRPGPGGPAGRATSTTRIRTPDTARLISALARDGIAARLAEADTVEVRGADPDRVARIAAAGGVVVLELSRHTDNLEDLFFDLTSPRTGDRTLEVSPS